MSLQALRLMESHPKKSNGNETNDFGIRIA